MFNREEYLKNLLDNRNRIFSNEEIPETSRISENKVEDKQKKAERNEISPLFKPRPYINFRNKEIIEYWERIFFNNNAYPMQNMILRMCEFELMEATNENVNECKSYIKWSKIHGYIEDTDPNTQLWSINY